MNNYKNLKKETKKTNDKSINAEVEFIHISACEGQEKKKEKGERNGRKRKMKKGERKDKIVLPVEKINNNNKSINFVLLICLHRKW